MTIQTDLRMHSAGVEQGIIDYVQKIQGRPVIFDDFPETHKPTVVGYVMNENGCSQNGHVSAILVTGLSEDHVELLLSLNPKADTDCVEDDGDDTEDDGDGIEEEDDNDDGDVTGKEEHCGQEVHVVKEMFGFFDGSWAGVSPVLRIKDSFFQKAFNNPNPLDCCRNFSGYYDETDGDDITVHLGAMKLPYVSVMKHPINSELVVSEEAAAMHMFNYIRALLDAY